MADLVTVLIAIGAGVLQLIVGLALASFTIWTGIRIFDKQTKNIDEIEELKKGNVAVGVLMAGVVLSIATIVQSGISGLSRAVTTVAPGSTASAYLYAILVGFIQVAIALLLASFAITLALKIFGKVTKGIDEEAELKKGNVAIAILMTGVLLSVAFVIQAGVSGLSAAIGSAL